MKVFLLHKAHDFDIKRKMPVNEESLIPDLGLQTLFNTMSLGDELVAEVVKRAVLCGDNDLDTVLYRQNILKDCLKNPLVVREIYSLTLELVEKERKSWFFMSGRSSPSSILYNAIGVMEILVEILIKLRTMVDRHSGMFESEGFTVLFAKLKDELTDNYIAEMRNHVEKLKFGDGVMISAELGKGNEGINYVLREPINNKMSWWKRLFNKKNIFSFSISNRDESGARALSEIRDRGINLVANALAKSADHIRNFITALRTELAFYIGCLNLYEELARIGAPTAFALPAAANERKCFFTGLYDVCLALIMKRKIVGNDINADGKDLVIITGANQGGKSTFLRSVGLAQLMMQSGMFVPAESFCSSLCPGMFTHYKREEDISMKSGKLDEELGRMSDIVDHISSNSILLLNESFAATNEKEGSEIARQILSALVEKSIRILFVTHLHEFAQGFRDKRAQNVLFLRAERKADGGRTFKIIEGEPLQTSYGEDLYYKIFETDNIAHKESRDDGNRIH